MSNFPKARLAVVGDLMVDRFVWGSVSRISPEAPVPVVRVDRESTSLGGAGNVARNLRTLGARVIPVGICGADRDGEHLAALLREAGIPTGGLVTVEGRPTTVKTRVVAHHQQVVRFDREEDGEIDRTVAQRLTGRAMESLSDADALIISDYDKGSLTPELLATVLPAAASRGIPVVVDPKVRLFAHYRPATVVTPNAREAGAAAGVAVRNEEQLIDAGRSLLRKLGSPHLLITRGERGMLLLDAGGATVRIPALAREVFDVSGAGDTVAATLALALASGASMREAAVLANAAAGIVVGRLGTAAVSGAELQRAFAGGRTPSGAPGGDPGQNAERQKRPH